MNQDYFKKYEPFWDEWTITRLIGTGNYSQVFEIERSDYWGSYKAALRAVTISPQSLGAIKGASIEMMDEEEQRVYLGGLVEAIVDEINRISRLRGNRNVVYYEDHKVIPHSEGIGWDILIRMELLVPLDTYARDHQLTRKDAIQLGLDMCRALEIYERRGIVHGDIRPEKILFSEREGFQLNACGVARIVDRFTGQLNETGIFRYMAPEIYSNEQFSPSSDQYSLGLVLYRMLNYHRLPFMQLTSDPVTQRDLEIALRRMTSGAKMPMPANGGNRLGKIVLKACAYRVADRYPSSAAMRMELSALLNEFAEEGSVYLGGELPETETIKPKPDVRDVAADRADPVIGPDTASTIAKKIPVERIIKKARSTESSIEKAKTKIKVGAGGALFLAVMNIILAILMVHDALFLIQGAVIGILGLGVLMRSRVCAVSLLVFFLVINLYPVYRIPGFESSVLFILIWGTFLIYGVIGTFTYHRLKKQVAQGVGDFDEALDKTSNKAKAAKEILYIVGVLFLIALFVVANNYSGNSIIVTTQGPQFRIGVEGEAPAYSGYLENELANLWGKSPSDVERALMMIEFEEYIPWGINGFMDSRTTLEAYGYNCILRLGFADERLANYTYRFLLEEDYVWQYRSIVEAGTAQFGEYDYSVFALRDENYVIDLDDLSNESIEVLLAENAGNCLTMWRGINTVGTFALSGDTLGNDAWTMDFQVMKN